MRPDHEGQRVPDVTFRTRQGADWVDVTTHDLFAGKRVVVFALPGAFTPTCSTAHVPRYDELVPAFAAQGVDDVVCVSVNDAFVMNAWQAEQGAQRITFVPDGNGAFTSGMGMLVDKADLGFGPRSWRYSMLVEDGVVTKQFIEPERPGDPFDVSDADTMLTFLGGEAPPAVLLYTRAHCGWCAKAKALLTEHGVAYHEVEATPGMLRAVAPAQTTPQVFIDGEHVGGYSELAARFG